MNTRSVLVPLDDSPLSCEALPYARMLAHLWNCSLALLGVVEPESAHLFAPSAEVRRYIEEVRREALTQHLRLQAEALSAGGLRVETFVVDGDAAESIVAAAEERGAAAIVMATRGRGGLERFMFGSVADKVLRTATCPVLAITPRGEGAARTDSTIELRRVLVPLDGSVLAEAALPVAAGLAAAAGASIVLLRVEPWLTTRTAAYPYVPELADAEADVTRMVSEYLEQAREKLPADLPVEVLVRRGEPSRDLVDRALDVEIDLVVMTTHGRGGVRRLILGSIADRLLRSGAPVLLLRPQSTTAGDVDSAAEREGSAAGVGAGAPR